MKKKELVYREILFQVMENKNKKMTQSGIAKTLGISLSTANNALQKLARMNAVKIRQRGFDVLDSRKILYYWASIRNLQKDIIYSTRVEKPVRTIESEMPDSIAFAAYSAYKLKFKDTPADYSEVYVYGRDIRDRFPESKKAPNIFVLKKDALMDRYGKTGTIAQTFVDLWNLREWYAKEFLNAMEERINAILE